MISLILLIALVIRLVALNQSLWLDEAINILAVKENSFWSIITKYPIGDFHPPGYFIILWVWDHVFGYSEIASRLPSIIFGVLTVYLTYLIGKKMIDNRVGILSASLLSVNPLHIYYSQEARMYSFAAFAAALSFYFFIDLLKEGRFKGLTYALSVSLVLYSDYLACLVLPVQAVLGFICLKPPLRKKFFIYLAIGVASIVPWLTIFPKQLNSGQAASHALAGWKTVVGGATSKELLLLPIKIIIGRISLVNKEIYGVAVGLISLLYLPLVPGLFEIRKEIRLLLVWFIIPPLAAFLISFFIPVFSYFRFIFVIPSFSLLVAVALLRLKSNLKWAILTLIIFTQLGAGLIYLTNPSFQREDWRGAAQFINSNQNISTMVLFENNDIFTPYRYYANNLTNAAGGLDFIPARSSADVSGLKEKLGARTRIYLFDYLVDITDPNRLLKSRISQMGFQELHQYDFSGVGIITLYQKE